MAYYLVSYQKLATQMGIHIADITADEFACFYQLPLMDEHNDPFDKMIIWQCISRKMVLVSHDSKLEKYTGIGLQYLQTENNVIKMI